jgi:hypothetical protein
MLRHRALPRENGSPHCSPTSGGSSNPDLDFRFGCDDVSDRLPGGDLAQLKSGDFQRVSLISEWILLLRPTMSGKASMYCREKISVKRFEPQIATVLGRITSTAIAYSS